MCQSHQQQTGCVDIAVRPSFSCVFVCHQHTAACVLSAVISAVRIVMMISTTRFRILGMLFMIFSLFLEKAVRHHRITDERINKALTYINEHIHESFNITQLADAASLSCEQFIRLFARQTGNTPTAYIISSKIHQAQMLLAERKMSIKQVATLLGYDNQSYFSRVFRQHVGMSPSMFIMQNK